MIADTLFVGIKNFLGDPTIYPLLVSRCPSAIARFVVAVRVNAINRVFHGRAFPHVRHEVLELHPPIANRDAPRPVVVEAGSLSVKASVFHGLPRAIGFIRWLAELREAMLRDCFELETSAGTMIATNHVVHMGDSESAAIASIFEKRPVSRRSSCERNYCEAVI